MYFPLESCNTNFAPDKVSPSTFFFVKSTVYVYTLTISVGVVDVDELFVGSFYNFFCKKMYLDFKHPYLHLFIILHLQKNLKSY